MTNRTRLTFFSVILTGICQGFLINRWGEADAQIPADIPVDQLPLALGNWQGETIEKPTGPDSQNVAHFSRRYVNAVNGKTVLVALTWGRPGPVAVHTPDVCYGGNGFEISAPFKYTPAFAAEPPQFFTSQFKRTTAAGSQCMRAFWAWNAGAGWQAPDNPRLSFARQARLVKVYFINDFTKENAPVDADPCLELMPLLLPEIQQLFFPG
jgi:hypothetical protein